MPDLIDVLPGVKLPVAEVTERLTTMWEGDASSSPSEFRASQMNIVLHFGLDVTPEDARERFDTVIRFAQRYPSRIIVLCPTPEVEDGSMSAKLFSQCYIGESHREMCCCEALMLRYQSEDHGFLANQVSVWLESDLPTYHWFSEVPAERIRTYFDNLLSVVRRTVYDSSIEPAEVAELDWPEPSRVSDLARARLLPVRQGIGQYLSGYPVERLCEGLKSIRVEHAPSMSGEGRHLTAWLKDCIGDCKRCADCPSLECQFETVEIEDETVDYVLKLEIEYKDDRYFRWRKFREGLLGEIESKINGEAETISTRVKPLAPEQALSEALFF